jgi:hypothetical protein
LAGALADLEQTLGTLRPEARPAGKKAS